MAVANYNGRKTSLVYFKRDGKCLIFHRTKNFKLARLSAMVFAPICPRVGTFCRG